MSLVPRIVHKNYSHENLKPLESGVSEKKFENVDFSSPQAASLNVSVTSNPSKIVGRVGKVPNLFGFANVDLDTLRRMEKFRALPHESLIDFRNEDSHRFCRQGTNQWAILHKGVLTSGNILGALGFKEAHVVSKIGLHSESASHQDLMRAVMVMREVETSAAVSPSAEEDEGDTIEKNEAIVKAYNEELKSSMVEERDGEWFDDDDDDDDDDGDAEEKDYLLRVRTETRKKKKRKSSSRLLEIAKVGFNITSISLRRHRWTYFVRQ